MRKYLAVALAAVLAFGVVNIATADEAVQTEDFKVKPKKLEKKKKKPINFINSISTAKMNSTDPASDQPPSATRTVVYFDKKNLFFKPSAVPQCKVSSSGIEGTTTADAIAACGAGSQVSVDSQSSAEVTVDNDPGSPGSTQTTIPVDVTAFNGKEKNSFYLHSKPTGAFAGLPPTILVGKLVSAKSVSIPGGDPGGSVKKFGKALDVTIPALAAGAISEFDVGVKAGKYITGRCKGKKTTVRATTIFSNHPTVSDEDVEKCKRKKKK